MGYCYICSVMNMGELFVNKVQNIRSCIVCTDGIRFTLGICG